MSYFAIERNGAYKDHILIKDTETDSVVFENYLNMTHDELMSQDDLEEFIVAIMDAVDIDMDSSESDHTILTLIGDDDVFIWSLLMGTVNDELKYFDIDWKKDGKNYRYES